MKTEIEVVYGRASGARLNLKRVDGCCLTLDFENEASIFNAKGKLVENLGPITDAHEFLQLALEFSSEPAVVLQRRAKLERGLTSKIRSIRSV